VCESVQPECKDSEYQLPRRKTAHEQEAHRPIVTVSLSLLQDRQPAMSRPRRASLSLRNRPKLSSTEPRNRSFSSASQPDGQNQHRARREHRAWTGDWSRMKSPIKVVRWRHGRASSSLGAGATVGPPGAAVSASSGSYWMVVPIGPSVAPSI